MAIPPNIKARLEQLRAEAALRAEMDRRRTKAIDNLESMSAPQPLLPWNPIPLKKADGGSANMKLERNSMGMHSPLEKAMMAVPRTKGTAAEFMAEASKQPGFRADEVADRRIAVPDHKLTKAEMLAHLKKHEAPKIKVSELGGDAYQEALDEKAKDIIGDWNATYDDLHGRDQDMAEAAVEDDFGYNPRTQYEDYKLPGGDNYREVLLKLPKRGLNKAQQHNLMIYEADMNRGRKLDPWHQKQYDELKQRQAAGSQDYYSPHWGNEHPNVLAHLRLSDRKGPNGEKILHVEEVQSDWHQHGRKEGYIAQDIEKQLEAGRERMAERGERIRQLTNQITPETPHEEFSRLSDEIQRLRELQAQETDWGNNLIDTKRYGVPDAPFKKNWHELALKHALTEAAKGGYHGIAITPGEEQADRYDLSKKIHSLSYDPEEKLLDAWDHNRKKVMRREITDPSQLEDYIGKDVASKLLKTEPVMGKHLLEGQDLKVGGEGMKGFYDKIVPDFLNKVGKKHGVKVAMNAIPVTAPKSKNADADDQLLSDLGVSTPEAKQPTLHYFPIPDTLRQQIKTEGLPQYDKGGKVDDNLKRFMAQSKVKNRVYHGTESKDDYDDDDRGNDAIKSFAGRATWVAEEPYTAHGYSGKSGYVMPLHIKIKKPLTISHVDANDDASHIYGLAKSLGVDVDHLKSMAEPESVWEVINHPYFIDAASKAGFDGISIKEGGRKTHAVFNPGNIKSAIGNRGTYDPSDPDITKAKGGAVQPLLPDFKE